MDTDKLIEALAADARPIRPLAPLSRRVTAWLAVALSAVAMVVGLMGLRPDLAGKLSEAMFALQQVAALGTAIAAAVAALAAGVPGERRWKLWLPSVPLAVWLGSLGHQCWQEWLRLGSHGMEFHPDFACVPGIAMVGLVPAVAMVVMLRRGAPFHPRTMMALGTLAAAALADFGLRLFHAADAALMVLVWQMGTVVLFTAVAGLAGPTVLAARGRM
ncbi:MAG TPA: NrsF family protein [Magnetospirillum sp.]|nr:NrsF family protein [Magnetospirillum sp.]